MYTIYKHQLVSVSSFGICTFKIYQTLKYYSDSCVSMYTLHKQHIMLFL